MIRRLRLPVGVLLLVAAATAAGCQPEARTVTITIPGKVDVVHNGHAVSIAKGAVPAHLREHGDCLGTSAIR